MLPCDSDRVSPFLGESYVIHDPGRQRIFPRHRRQNLTAHLLEKRVIAPSRVSHDVLSSPRNPVDRRLWLPGAMPFPPQATACRSRQPTSSFNYPVHNPSIRPETLPVRTERHNPHPIATLHRQIATHLARSVPRCPCCLRGFLVLDI